MPENPNTIYLFWNSSMTFLDSERLREFGSGKVVIDTPQDACDFIETSRHLLRRVPGATKPLEALIDPNLIDILGARQHRGRLIPEGPMHYILPQGSDHAMILEYGNAGDESAHLVVYPTPGHVQGLRQQCPWIQR